MAFGERDPVAQVDDPFAGGEPGGYLLGVGDRGGGEVDGAGPAELVGAMWA